ncbi:MAG: thioether cross-link-forming SCIFF peptide maturase [Firmicutes bacterium]|nr:thioether cross-link-forming SCIFF peptide maturase [Bacillota bacterium]
MVHVFSSLGGDFALDVESGTLVRLDNAAKKIIEFLNGVALSSNNQNSQLSPAIGTGDFLVCALDNYQYSDGKTEREEEKEAAQEIKELIQEGLLFSEGGCEEIPKHSGLVKALCLNVSHNCDLRCKYCFADGGSYNTKRKNMPFDVAKAAIDFLVERSGTRKNLEIDFFGGEPLLNMDIVKKTVAYARELEKKRGKNFRFTITTNAVGLNDELTDYFNKEMYNVVISIDGRENVHNSVRLDASGRGSFSQVLGAAKRFRERRGGKLYYIRGTFTALNKDFSADVLAINDYGFDQISLEPVVLPPDHPLALTENDLPQLKAQYEVLAEEYVKRNGVLSKASAEETARGGAATGENRKFIFFHFNVDFEGGPCLKKRVTGCGAGCEYLAVNPDGDIFPCHRFDGKNEYKIGNVLNGEFDDTIPKSFAASCVYTKDECKSCFCKYYCGGGCAANSIEYGGGINGRYAIGCELMKKRIEVALTIRE